MDGEHYIRGLSDAELERFTGLNRNMYTKAEIKVADEELARRKRMRAAQAAGAAAPQPEPQPADTRPPEMEASRAADAPLEAEARAEAKQGGVPAAIKDAPPAEGEPFMYCIYCGAKVSLNAVYCTRCGKRVALDDDEME